MTDINTVVRFNQDSKEIEVVLTAGEAEEVIGTVEEDIYKNWFPEPVDNTEQIAALESERDEWKQKYETLKEVIPSTPVAPPGEETPPVEDPAE